jgi:hypothetical protein
MEGQRGWAVIDLKGASSSQVNAIKNFVGTLTKQQGKINYVD